MGPDGRGWTRTRCSGWHSGSEDHPASRTRSSSSTARSRTRCPTSTSRPNRRASSLVSGAVTGRPPDPTGRTRDPCALQRPLVGRTPRPVTTPAPPAVCWLARDRARSARARGSGWGLRNAGGDAAPAQCRPRGPNGARQACEEPMSAVLRAGSGVGPPRWSPRWWGTIWPDPPPPAAPGLRWCTRPRTTRAGHRSWIAAPKLRHFYAATARARLQSIHRACAANSIPELAGLVPDHSRPADRAAGLLQQRTGQQRTRRSRQPGHQTRQMRRIRLPQLRQLPTPAAPPLRHYLAH